MLKAGGMLARPSQKNAVLGDQYKYYESVNSC